METRATDETASEKSIDALPVIISEWKGIAEYLGKAVRTIQRWESEFGLPVRRIPGKSPKASVIAFRTEIDAWVKALRVGGKFREPQRVGRLLRRVEELQLENQDLRRKLEDLAHEKGSK